MRTIEFKFLKSTKQECRKLKKLPFVPLDKMRTIVLTAPDEHIHDLLEKLEKEKCRWSLRKFHLPDIWFVSTMEDLVGINPLGVYYMTQDFQDTELERLLRLRIQSRMGLDFPAKGFKETK